MFSRDPFLEPAKPRWAAIVADAYVELLAVRGLHEFSMAAVARWMRASTAAVAQRAPRRESLRLVVSRVGARYHWWSVRPSHWVIEPRLPATEAELLGVRAWALLGELARGDAAAEAELAARRAAERADVEEWWRRERGGDGGDGRDGFEEYFAVLTGLRLVLAFGLASLTAGEARAVLDRLAPPSTEALRRRGAADGSWSGLSDR